MEYKHLSQDNRITIAEEILRGTPVAAIALKVGCHKLTIHREINRNRRKRMHYERYATHNMACRCRAKASRLPRKLKEKSSREVAKAMMKMLAGYEVKTITSDRGSEFARYRLVEEETGGEWFACDPRRPDQRGGIEGGIRQMRYDYPRGMVADDITPSKLATDIHRLNNTPRKSLGYKTAAEMTTKMMAKTTAKANPL